MPLYNYEASTKEGDLTKGTYEAGSSQEVADYLHSKELVIVTIEEKIGINKLANIQIGGIPYKEKVFLVKQLTFMLEAGLPIIQALEVLVDQTKYAALKTKLTNVYKDVKGGLPLSKSFAKQDALFDEIQLSLIEAGEKSGNLIEVLEQIAVDIEKKHKLKSKIKNAMIYPVIIVSTAIVVLIVLIIYMVPAVVELYTDLGAADKIPFVTRVLIAISTFFTSPIGLISVVLILLAIVITYKITYSSENGRKVIDKAKLHIPVFGTLINNIQVVEMTRLLSMLMKSGIPIIDAMYSTASSLGNIHYKNALISTAKKVSKGSSIAVSLARSDVIPMLVVKMIATGEDTGSLDKILTDLSGFYENEVNETTANLTSLMEPVMLLLVGVLVAFLAIAVYLPIYNVAQII